MNNEKYSKIISDAYKRYVNHWGDPIDPVNFELYTRLDLHPDKRLFTKEEFVDKIKTDDEFSKTWDLKIEERELSLEERYNIWFNNNYETGMERYFDPNNLPDFDNEYYEPTPTKLITVTYNNEIIESYDN